MNREQIISPHHNITLTRPRPILVEADPDRIDEVLMTLLDNSVHFSPNNKRIEVRVWVENGEALVAVKDHGVGIPRQRQAHIFEPFYEPLPAGVPGYRGTVTLSLYLSKLIIERHGGRIWFESEVGKGSTFYFALRLNKPDEMKKTEKSVGRDGQQGPD